MQAHNGICGPFGIVCVRVFRPPKTSLAMGLAMKTLTYAIVKTILCC